MIDTNVTKFVANKIKTFREQKNITQKELAEALNTTQQSIARYENGERKADQNILFAMADFFNVSINEFFPPIKTEASQKEKYILLKETLKEKGLIDENDNIDEAQLDKILQITEIIKTIDNKKNQ